MKISDGVRTLAPAIVAAGHTGRVPTLEFARIPPDEPPADEYLPDDAPAIVHWRKVTAAGLVGVGVLAVGSVIVSWWNPQRHLYLLALADPDASMTVLAAAFVALGVAALMGLRRRPAMIAGIVAWVLLAVLLWICARPALSWTRDLDFHPAGPVTTVALSPDDRFAVVATTYRSDYDSDYQFDRFWLRSRAGVLSRESRGSFARMWYRYGEPGGDVVATRFVAAHEVELETDDGRTWRVSFDARTLSPTRTLSTCESDRYCWTSTR